MALLTVQPWDKDGLALTTVAPTATTGDTFVASDDQRHGILVFNGSESSINVTVEKKRSTAPQQGVGPDVAVSDIVLAVAAGKIAVIPVLPAYISGNDGLVKVTCSAVVTVEIAIVRFPRLV